MVVEYDLCKKVEILEVNNLRRIRGMLPSFAVAILLFLSLHIN